MPDLASLVNGSRNRLDRIAAWLRDRERFVLLAGVGFQVIVLLAMIGLRLMPLLTGDTILVRVVPVDPRDFFRGDYVVLSYEFSQVPATIEGPHRGSHLGRTVYVTLVPEPDGKHWRAEKYSFNHPKGGKYLRGRIVGSGQIEYGIESYYLQEGKGYYYEQAVRNRTLSAEIAVGAEGQAALRGLRIDSK